MGLFITFSTGEAACSVSLIPVETSWATGATTLVVNQLSASVISEGWDSVDWETACWELVSEMTWVPLATAWAFPEGSEEAEAGSTVSPGDLESSGAAFITWVNFWSRVGDGRVGVVVGVVAVRVAGSAGIVI